MSNNCTRIVQRLLSHLFRIGKVTLAEDVPPNTAERLQIFACVVFCHSTTCFPNVCLVPQTQCFASTHLPQTHLQTSSCHSLTFPQHAEGNFLMEPEYVYDYLHKAGHSIALEISFGLQNGMFNCTQKFSN